MEIYNHRGRLINTKEAIRRGKLTIGFIGGSITDGRSMHNWPEPVAAWFVDKFPGVRIQVENAAIGATGSDLAVFRADRDLIDRGCNLVFIEIAVNDMEEPAEKRRRTQEGLIRKLLKDGKRDVVVLYVYCQEMYDDMMNGRVPWLIEDFEQINRHYNLGSVWMGRYALDEVIKGKMRWEEWLPDGLHPQSRGSLSYGQCAIAFLEEELKQGHAGSGSDILSGDKLLPPLNSAHWGNISFIPFEEVKLEGAWQVKRWLTLVWVDQVLSTSAPGAKLSFHFEGRALSLGFDFGKASSEFKYRVDGGEWQEAVRDRPDWCGEMNWFRIFNVADDLAPGGHFFELEVTHGNRPECSKGNHFNLAMIGVVR
jgi:lysophospholipase L1-like esterase